MGDIRMVTTRKESGWSETGVYVGNDLHGNRRHKPMRDVDGSIYLVFWEKNASTPHPA